MASKRVIEVRITSKEVGSKKKTEPKNDVDSDLKVNTLFDNAIFQQALNGAKSQLSEMALYGINRHLQLTNDYLGERYLKTGVNVISRLVSTTKAIKAGGMVGGVYGAVVAAILSVADLTFDIVKAQDQQNIHIAQMDKQLQYQRQRAGYSLTSGSIGENK